MNLFGFVKTYWKTLALAAGVIVLAVSVVWGLRAMGSAINEHKIGKLETQKQQALKERDEARARDLMLQGQVQAKDELINSLTSQLAESNTKVEDAHKDTQTARASYQKVRSDPPKFNSADDAGRISELQSELRGLYPDSP